MLNKSYLFNNGEKRIEQLIGCFRTTASEIKKSGLIDEAITQFGRTIVDDAELVLQLAKSRKKRQVKKEMTSSAEFSINLLIHPNWFSECLFVNFNSP